MKKTIGDLDEYIHNGKAENFYTWAEWTKIRKEVLRLDHYECQMCKQSGKHTKAEIVHHVNHLKNRPDLALRIYDENGKRNLISLCRACHEAEHPERRKAFLSAQQQTITKERWD